MKPADRHRVRECAEHGVREGDRRKEDIEAIQEGIEAMDAGRTIPLVEADRLIREELGFRPREE